MFISNPWQRIKDKRTSLIMNVNSHGLYFASKSTEYRRILNTADVLYADGWGPVVLSKISDSSLREKA